MYPLRSFALSAVAWLLVASSQAWAGPVSLNPPEVAELRSLVALDSAAGVLFAKVRTAAERALGEEPAPVDKVISEGHLSNDPGVIRTQAAFKDKGKIEALGWAWAVTADQRFLAKLRAFLVAWAQVNQPDGDPINETNFEPMIVAYDLARADFPAPERNTVDAWLRGKARGLLGRPATHNNFADHEAKIVGLVGLVLEDGTLTSAAANLLNAQLATEIHQDGSSTDFHERDALHYHLYVVQPMLTLSRALARAKPSRFDFASSLGAKLRKAVDFVTPFAEGAKTHVEFVNSKVAFDRKRAMNGQAEYQPHPWEPKEATGMYEAAAWFDPAYGALACKVAGNTDQKYLNWAMVVGSVAKRGAP